MIDVFRWMDGAWWNGEVKGQREGLFIVDSFLNSQDDDGIFASYSLSFRRN